jgi:hypothetical protein
MQSRFNSDNQECNTTNVLEKIFVERIYKPNIMGERHGNILVSPKGTGTIAFSFRAL